MGEKISVRKHQEKKPTTRSRHGQYNNTKILEEQVVKM
jgi:hypothetical protein